MAEMRSPKIGDVTWIRGYVRMFYIQGFSTLNQQLRKRPNQEGTRHPRPVKVRIL